MMKEMKAKLTKRCPCCGSTNIKTDNPKWLKDNSLRLVEIWCDDCKLKAEAHVGLDGKDLADAYRVALMRWNRRAA